MPEEEDHGYGIKFYDRAMYQRGELSDQYKWDVAWWRSEFTVITEKRAQKLKEKWDAQN